MVFSPGWSELMKFYCISKKKKERKEKKRKRKRKTYGKMYRT
jgi:hypothetical protein